MVVDLPSPWPRRARRLHDVHRFFREQRLYAVTLLSAAACALFAARVLGVASRDFAFMLWNLALAWVPYACAFAAAALERLRVPGRAPLVFALSVVWLAFFPNAPYLVTDLLHLRAWTPVPICYDVAMFATFSWAGCLLGVASLDAVRRIVAERAGALAARAVVLVALATGGLGIYLGRIVRLNSWDLALRPGRVLADAWSSVQSRQGVLFSLLFSGFFFVCYVALRAPRAAARAD